MYILKKTNTNKWPYTCIANIVKILINTGTFIRMMCIHEEEDGAILQAFRLKETDYNLKSFKLLIHFMF